MGRGKEYIEKGGLLGWLYRKKVSCDRCADKASQRHDRISALLHSDNADVFDEVIDRILFDSESYSLSEDTSDGYHTFKELYHHRAILFSVIVAIFPELSWKSMKHHDGTMYDGMFIVGINTPSGQATYHYDVEPYWSIFRCKDLENAPEWDGHTPESAIRRISTLKGYSALINYGGKKHEEV